MYNMTDGHTGSFTSNKKLRKCNKRKSIPTSAAELWRRSGSPEIDGCND